MKKIKVNILLVAALLYLNAALIYTPLEETALARTTNITEEENIKANSYIDSSRNINNDEPNISLFQLDKDNKMITKDTPVTLGVTNTSNVNINLDKLIFNYYYLKENPQMNDDFTLSSASILGKDKDLLSFTKTECHPIYSDWYYNERCYFKTSFNKANEVLEPGETLVIKGNFTPKKEDTNRSLLCEPVITYDGESIYGDLPEEFLKDSEIISDDIKLNSKKLSDTPIKLKLNSNTLKEINLYSEGTFIKMLKADDDYTLNKRNKVILKKTFLSALFKDFITLDFKFNNGRDDTINIKNESFNKNLKKGSLTLNNEETTALGMSITGSPYSFKWGNLNVPINISNAENERSISYNLILKFNHKLFDKVTAESLCPENFSATVNYDLGIIKINLNSPKAISSIQNKNCFTLILTPNGNTHPQKVTLTLSEDSYYINEKGSKLKPQFNYQPLELKINRPLQSLSYQ